MRFAILWMAGMRQHSSFSRVAISALLSRRYSHNGKQLAEDAATTLAEDEVKHRKYYSISGTGSMSEVAMMTNSGHALHTDVPIQMGGSDMAPQPVEHLLAALIGCTQATTMYVSRRMSPRMTIDTIDFENFIAYRDERGALDLPIDRLPSCSSRLQYVTGTVRVHFKATSSVTHEQLRILAEQTEARCPIASMMHASGCVLDIEWVMGSTDTSS